MSTSGSNQLTSKSSDLRSLATKIAANNPPAQPNPASRSPEPQERFRTASPERWGSSDQLGMLQQLGVTQLVTG